MSEEGKPGLRKENGIPVFFKEGLADILTFSRGLIGLAIVSMSFVGEDAYLAVVILVLVGVVTDLFDGRVARHYLGKNREGKLGKYDLEIDTYFFLCAIGYLSFSEIVIPRVVGLGWIVLALIAIVLDKRKPRILFVVEIPSILAVITISGIYDLKIFLLVIIPAICAGLIFNYRRTLYIMFKYIPEVLSE